MCRWMAYTGEPVVIEELLFKPEHSLIDQSLNARLLSGITTNADGFGIGWYGIGDEPAVFKSVYPAWNDRNLREIATQIRTPMLFAHVRASSGTDVQRSNCHPFRYGRWLWMHNGTLNGFPQIKRELVMSVDPALYPHIEGSTDSEVLFFLALTFGLTEDPFTAVARAVGLVERVARDRNIERPVAMTVATAEGESMWLFRYSSEGKAPSLFYSTDVATLIALYPDIEKLRQAGQEARLVVSEPLVDLPGVWNEAPEFASAVVRPGQDEMRPFRPVEPG
jgi:predicted glutamine amidotransferase